MKKDGLEIGRLFRFSCCDIIIKLPQRTHSLLNVVAFDMLYDTCVREKIFCSHKIFCIFLEPYLNAQGLNKREW